MTKVTIGGWNEHCCTQLASMPVSRVSRARVRMNRPLGMRPRAEARLFCGSVLCMKAPKITVNQSCLFLAQHADDNFFQRVIVDSLVGIGAAEANPFALAVKHIVTRQRYYEIQLFRPDFGRLLQVQVEKRRADLAQK